MHRPLYVVESQRPLHTLRGRGGAAVTHRRQRVRDLRDDLPSILGGLALSTAVLLLFAATLGFSVALEVAQTWPPLLWIALGALALALLSLQVLFFREYLRWRRMMAVAQRG